MQSIDKEGDRPNESAWAELARTLKYFDRPPNLFLFSSAIMDRQPTRSWPLLSWIYTLSAPRIGDIRGNFLPFPSTYAPLFFPFFFMAVQYKRHVATYKMRERKNIPPSFLLSSVPLGLQRSFLLPSNASVCSNEKSDCQMIAHKSFPRYLHPFYPIPRLFSVTKDILYRSRQKWPKLPYGFAATFASSPSPLISHIAARGADSD